MHRTNVEAITCLRERVVALQGEIEINDAYIHDYSKNVEALEQTCQQTLDLVTEVCTEDAGA